jgi:hypothetical protein
MACENASVDMDCPPGLTDGAGYNLRVNANLIMGNTAESGSGGGLRLQNINGNDVALNQSKPGGWDSISVTNNIIADNVAGWIGGGVSLYDAVKVSFINNTVISNDDTASAGVLFDTLGAPNANQPPPGCNPVANPNCTGNGVISTNGNSNFEPAGVASEHHSAALSAAFSTTASVNTANCITIGSSGVPLLNCDKFSNPVMANNLIWQNRAFHITTSNPGAGLQSAVTLVPALNQINPISNIGATGSCPTGANYWDIGVYGDAGAGSHVSGFHFAPQYSIVGDPGYAGTNGNPPTPTTSGVVQQYCNGSRVPPEIAGSVCSTNASAPGCNNGGNGGMAGSPGVPDINPFYPVFTLNPAATTDEGNNYINMFYGPLTLSNPTIASGSSGYNVALGNYALQAGSPAVDAIPNTATTFSLAPALDFFGNKRLTDGNNTAVDIGAVEFIVRRSFSVDPTALTFTSFYLTPTAVQNVTVANTGDVPLSFTAGGLGSQFAAPPNGCTNVAAGASCTFSVTYTPTTTALTSTATMSINYVGGAGTAVTVSLTGHLFVPTYTVAPTGPLSFTSTIGVKTIAQTVTIANTSTNGAPLTITSVNITGATSGAGFTATTCPATLPATAGSNTCIVSVTMTPTSGGPKIGTLNFNVGAPATPATRSVSLTGTVPVATYTVTWTGAPAALAFGNQVVGTTGTPLSVTITNTSGASGLALPISVTKPTTGNGNQNQWTAVTNGCPAILPATAGSNTCTASVAFAPTFQGPMGSSLRIAAGGGALPATTTVPISGTGVQGTITFASSPAAFGNVSLGSSQQLGIVATVANFPVTFTSSNISSSSGGRFTLVTNGCTGTVNSGSTCTITVQFAPGTIGAGTLRTGALTVADNAAGGAQSVPLTGTGVTPPAPALTGISPASRTRGTPPVSVTLTGTNLTATSAVTVSGANIIVSSVVVNAAGTQVSANFAVQGTATLGARTVSVTTPGGTSNTEPFTVN